MTRAEKALKNWEEIAAGTLDDALIWNPPDFIYDDQPDGIYFTTDKYFLYFLKEHQILTATPGRPDARRRPRLHCWIEEASQTATRATQAQKGKLHSGARVVQLQTEDGKTAYIRSQYYNRLPAATLYYVAGLRQMVIACLMTDAGKLETVAGIMPIMANGSKFTPNPGKEARPE